MNADTVCRYNCSSPSAGRRPRCICHRMQKSKIAFSGREAAVTRHWVETPTAGAAALAEEGTGEGRHARKGARRRPHHELRRARRHRLPLQWHVRRLWSASKLGSLRCYRALPPQRHAQHSNMCYSHRLHCARLTASPAAERAISSGDQPQWSRPGRRGGQAAAGRAPEGGGRGTEGRGAMSSKVTVSSSSSAATDAALMRLMRSAGSASSAASASCTSSRREGALVGALPALQPLLNSPSPPDCGLGFTAPASDSVNREPSQLPVGRARAISAERAGWDVTGQGGMGKERGGWGAAAARFEGTQGNSAFLPLRRNVRALLGALLEQVLPVPGRTDRENHSS